MVALRSALRRQEIRSSNQAGTPMKISTPMLANGSEELPVVASTIWFWNFRYEKRMLWREAAGIEIHAGYMVAGNILVVVDGIAESESGNREFLK